MLNVLNVLLFFFFKLKRVPGTGECQSVPQSGDVSAVPCPRIDTQQLDRQIKAIMKEVIPFLKVRALHTMV